MEKTVERLEGMLQKADSDINCLMQKIDHEFKNNNESAPNPVELTRKVREAREEFTAIVQQAEAIKQEQQTAVAELRKDLSGVCQLLLTLQNRTGESTEKPPELTQIEEYLGTEIPWGPGPSGEALQESAGGDAGSTASCTGAATNQGSGASNT